MGILSAIASAASYSVSNYIDKFLLENQNLNYYFITIISGIFGFTIGLLIALFVGVYTQDTKTILLIIASGFFISISLLPYYKALSLDETSRIIPLFLLTPVFVLIMDFIILGEILTIKQFVGACIILISAFVISMEEPRLDKIFRLRPSLWFMMLACFLYALSIICYKFGIKEIPFFQSLTYEGVGFLLCSVVLLLPKSKWKFFLDNLRRIKKKAYSFIAINESFNLLAIYFYWFSLLFISASLASIIMQGIQPFITLMFGAILSIFFPKIIKESLDKKNIFTKLLCSFSMFLGFYFILF